MKKTLIALFACVAAVATADPTIRVLTLANPNLRVVSLGSPLDELWDIAVSTNLVDWTPVPVGNWQNISSSTNTVDAHLREYYVTNVTNRPSQFFKPVFRRFVLP